MAGSILNGLPLAVGGGTSDRERAANIRGKQIHLTAGIDIGQSEHSVSVNQYRDEDEYAASRLDAKAQRNLYVVEVTGDFGIGNLYAGNKMGIYAPEYPGCERRIRNPRQQRRREHARKHHQEYR